MRSAEVDIEIGAEPEPPTRLRKLRRGKQGGCYRSELLDEDFAGAPAGMQVTG
jgi:hypothetical protein